LALNCFANAITILDSLNSISTSNKTIQITAPYTILSKAKYTPDLDVYKYNNLSLNIIDHDNPEQITLQVSKNDAVIEDVAIKPQYSLPWWSESAPKILRQFDFSKVNGKATVYQLDAKHRLTLLPHQGCWGKVYVLEETDAQGNTKIICAMKILLNKRENQEEYFRQRHKTEIENNLIATNFEIAIKTYAIIENDPDHYLVFLEYGQYARDRFANQPLDITLRDLNVFIQELNELHEAGYAHGDLNLGNLLYVDNKLKLCDWYSLLNIRTSSVNEYRYIGNNLPPEALRAFYYDKMVQSNKEDMRYAIDNDEVKHKIYWLHPVAADRYCLGISMMEILSPDLHKIIAKEPFPKDFTPYSPTSLEFWPKYATIILQMQYDLLQRSRAINDPNNNQAKVLAQIVEFINLDPMQRI
jgi:serine/threonine protein kinase